MDSKLKEDKLPNYRFSTISWSIQHYSRLLNGAAHKLACDVLSLKYEHIDIDCISECIKPIVLARGQFCD